MSDKKPGSRPGFYRGDEVYFDHPSGPLTGRVLAHGKHGCTIECGKGKRHRVKWDRVLGHKKRSALNYRIVEDGEDGMIVEDDTGRRRFIGVQSADSPERIIVRGSEARTVPVAEKKPASAPAKKEPKGNPEDADQLRKSETLPKILLWSI